MATSLGLVDTTLIPAFPELPSIPGVPTFPTTAPTTGTNLPTTPQGTTPVPVTPPPAPPPPAPVAPAPTFMESYGSTLVAASVTAALVLVGLKVARVI